MPLPIVLTDRRGYELTSSGLGEFIAAPMPVCVTSSNGSPLTPTDVTGGGMTVVTKTLDYAASAGDFVLVDTTAGDVSITLPAANSTAPVYVKKISGDSNGVVIVPPTDATLDNADSYTFSMAFKAVAAVPDGTNYWLF